MGLRKIVLISLTGLFLMSCFYIFSTPEAFKARGNVKNMKRIRIGMDNNEVLKIMGKPDGKRYLF